MFRLLSPFFLVLLLCSTVCSEEETVEVSGVDFPVRSMVGDTELEIRGGGKAMYLFFSLYSAALYLPPEVSTDEIFLGVVPKQLTLHYLREIPKRYIIEAAENVLVKNPNNDMDALRERLDRLYEAFHDVGKGDEYTMTFTPEEGTAFLFNGEEEIRIPGADFASAFFGIWLAEESLSSRLREQLFDPERVRR